MAEYITLLGAEDVQRASNNMQQAADEMQRAAGSIEDSVRRLELLADVFPIDQLIAAMEKKGED